MRARNEGNRAVVAKRVARWKKKWKLTARQQKIAWGAVLSLSLLFVCGGIAKSIHHGLRGQDPYADAGLLELAYDASDTDIPHENRIILVVPASDGSQNANARLGDILSSLQEAAYDRDRVALEAVFAPDLNSSALRMRLDMVSSMMWPHGPRMIRNVSSGGHFDLLLDAWVPTRKDTARVVIIDAAVAKPFGPDFYTFLKSVRARYRHRSTDVAGFGIEPTVVRTRSSDSGYVTYKPRHMVQSPEEDIVFMYQVLDPDQGVFAPLDASTWRVFRRWFAAHRAEWFLWPVVVEAKDKKDSSWNSYRGTLRAHWTSWFTRFCSEYGLYVVYPFAPHPAAVAPASYTHAGTGQISQYNFNGVKVSPKLSISSESMRKILELGIHGGGSVSMTVVNEAFINTAKSWTCNVDAAGIRPPGVVWIATDSIANDAMSAINGTETVFLSELHGGSKEKGTSYGTPGYWLLMLERTRLIREILDRGIGVFAFETDQIWLSDPVPHVQRLINGGDEVDVVGTLDSRHEIGGNFLYLNPTLATKRLWREVSFRFEREFYAQKMDKRTSLKHKYMENDQSLLTKLIFFDHEFKIRSPVVFRALNTELFVDGRWYEYPDVKIYASPQARSPVLINNNFLIGIDAKMQRAKKHGHWFLKSPTAGNSAPSDQLPAWCDADQVRKAVAENDERARRSSGAERGREHVVRPDAQADLAIALGAINEGRRKGGFHESGVA